MSDIKLTGVAKLTPRQQFERDLDNGNPHALYLKRGVLPLAKSISEGVLLQFQRRAARREADANRFMEKLEEARDVSDETYIDNFLVTVSPPVDDTPAPPPSPSLSSADPLPQLPSVPSPAPNLLTAGCTIDWDAFFTYLAALEPPAFEHFLCTIDDATLAFILGVWTQPVLLGDAPVGEEPWAAGAELVEVAPTSVST
ncbi:hypothetical protein BOTBODRAFT_39441 [Botryobasidium botryosum FD-172 SS1]|uniref:Uncharacterized protein n=1 Tax=Botryobasidium botryosum (strain FD-172 SS1) TaxID=930990 RepID=A0A067M428_BOTB1|nr:hypothetical protein BOTBODRAFT_39441 [Botryobasidium botryosum FD-172 SS1]